jgi:hypothetical protein
LLIFRILAVLALAVTASAPPAARAAAPDPAREIRYLSTDLNFVMIFANGQAEFGAPIVLGTYPFEYVGAGNDVRCLSMRVTGETSAQFAIRRPIRAGARYSCLRTTFRVSRCFRDCRAAIVEVGIPLSGGVPGRRTAYMYVDSCRGLLAYSPVRDFAQGIPLDAAWLRGEVGILADPNDPGCESS